MRTIIVGLGNQGRKRKAVAGKDAVATIDPFVEDADYPTIQNVPLDAFDEALVCTPDEQKLEVLTYLLGHGKHVMVEKPFPSIPQSEIDKIADLARSAGVACYTAYNHRFEPHIASLAALLSAGSLGNLYTARLFYGNGTAQDVKSSPWRDTGSGVWHDLGSHLLDITLFLFGTSVGRFETWAADQFETRSFDHAVFASNGCPAVQLEASYLSWRNTFTADVYGELGSAHINSLCKWGPSTLTVRRRVFPSGVPHEEVHTLECSDPTWGNEYEYFKGLCMNGGTNLNNDRWINSILEEITPVTTSRKSR